MFVPRYHVVTDLPDPPADEACPMTWRWPVEKSRFAQAEIVQLLSSKGSCVWVTCTRPVPEVEDAAPFVVGATIPVAADRVPASIDAVTFPVLSVVAALSQEKYAAKLSAKVGAEAAPVP